MPPSHCAHLTSFLLPENVASGVIPWWLWLLFGILLGSSVYLRRSWWALAPVSLFLGLLTLGFAGQIRDHYRYTVAKWTIDPRYEQRLGTYRARYRTDGQRQTVPPVYVARDEHERVKAMTIRDYGCRHGLLVKAEPRSLDGVPTESDHQVRQIAHSNRMDWETRRIQSQRSFERWENRIVMVNTERSPDVGFSFEWCRQLRGSLYYCEANENKIAMANGTRY